MQKISTMRASGKNIFEGQLTIGLDLGDRSSAHCVLNAAGQIVLEHKLATTPEAMKQVFGSMPRSRIAMETGMHSPWVSRLLTALGHEVIVGHAQKVRANGRVAIEAAWLRGKKERRTHGKSKTLLTGAGLLMEGPEAVSDLNS